METKICTICGKELPKTLNFFYEKGGNLGKNGELRPTCKQCTLNKNKVYTTKWEQRQTNKLYWNAKMRAKRFGLEFNITENDIIIPKKCPLLDIDIYPGKEVVSKHSPTIDRIDTTKGYIKGNIQVVSHKANFINTNLTLEELRNFIKNIPKMYK